MRKSIVVQGLLLAILLLSGLAVHAEDDPLTDPTVQKTLRAMKDASTWYHPDQFGQFAGMRHYAHHEYKDALKYFEVGAFYADKMSQLSIGLMHLNGEGTGKDPIAAYAWLDLAAERDYPDFVATRDRVKSELTADQMQKAAALRAELAQKYADAVAKPRMAKQLKLGQMQLTGSRTGFDYGVSQLSTKPDCAPSVVVGGQETPSAGCGFSTTNTKARWDPDQYFASRDAEYKATVSVGAVEQQTKPADKPAQPDAQDAQKH